MGNGEWGWGDIWGHTEQKTRSCSFSPFVYDVSTVSFIQWFFIVVHINRRSAIHRSTSHATSRWLLMNRTFATGCSVVVPNQSRAAKAMALFPSRSPPSPPSASSSSPS